MVEDVLIRITLAVIIGTLAAIVYSLRVLVMMERRVGRIEQHLDRMVHKTLRKEIEISKALKRRRR